MTDRLENTEIADFLEAYTETVEDAETAVLFTLSTSGEVASVAFHSIPEMLPADLQDQLDDVLDAIHRSIRSSELRAFN